MSSIIRLRRGVIAVVLLASGPAHAGPTRLPHPPYPRPDGERHLRRSRSVQRLLCKTYTASRRCIDLEGKLSLRSHTLADGAAPGSKLESTSLTLSCSHSFSGRHVRGLQKIGRVAS